MTSQQMKQFRQHEKELKVIFEEQGKEKISSDSSLKKLETCQKLSDSLAERATAVKPLPAVATSTMEGIKTSHDALNKLKVCTARYKQLCIDHANARADLNLKKEAYIIAKRALDHAESSYEKLGHRANTLDNGQINTIRKQVNDLQNDVNNAEQTFKSLDRELSYSPTQMEITRGEFAFLQSTEIIRQALINAGLLNAIQQSITLIRSKKAEVGAEEVKKELMKAFFNAVLTDNKLPSFETSLQAINDYID